MLKFPGKHCDALVCYWVNRKGSRLGHDSIVDGMLKDGLWDVYNDFGMGVCAEICAENHSITREQQVLIHDLTHFKLSYFSSQQ